MAWSSTTFSFAFKVSPPIARSSTTSLRTTPTIVRLSQFTKKSSLNLSSSHTISGFFPILPRLNFPTPNPPSLTVVSAKGYKMKTHKASAKRFRVTGSGKIMRRRAGKQHLLGKKNTKRKLRLSKMTMKGFMWLISNPRPDFLPLGPVCFQRWNGGD
ncbi:50S ribosomal protein L35, chloroplastic-like isoform X4 [Camellia sinensis]|uniref:50S ribosomal protein L35, chloroplastic-like isoform X4 n=1 Tax=Camellia sinensis TaxID=4442 RepID=UPI001035DC1F|nr:50S ribosomal protein L35, chloroplastic-like isoform X4 [Camellia sinensis]